MKLKLAAIPAFGLLVLAAAVLSQESARSTSDGIFTAEQAKRGRTSFSANCAICHGEQLEGSESGASLSGSDFALSWGGRTVGDLFDRLHNTMPPDNPGKLSRAESADITAYILSFNKYPAGTAELSSDADLLKQIRINADKPAK